MIRLTQETRTPSSDMNISAFPVRLTAEWTSDDSPAKIFVMQEAVEGGIPGDRFSCIASARQIEDLPEDAVGDSSPFYRTDSVLLIFGSAAHAHEFWDKAQDVVKSLVNDLQAVEQLGVTTTVTIAPDPL